MRASLSTGAEVVRAEVVRAERTPAAAAATVLATGLARARARVMRRIRALRGDLERIAGAEADSRQAQLFVTEAARAPRGTSRLVAVDWSSGEARDVAMSFDPALPPKQQLDALFHRARRLKSGASIATARLRDAECIVAGLDDLAAKLASSDADLDALASAARALAPRDFAPERTKPARGRAPEAAAPPYRTFLATSGAPIWVGRGAARNDELTLHVARPHHLWMHARGYAGAHVVVPLAKGASCPGDLLVEAAHLAAHFSKARGESLVEIGYVPRRYVRKPRGSPPGLVVVTREKTLELRRSDDLLRRLLDRELRSPAPSTR